MTQLTLEKLSDRIKAHKEVLIHIVKPPVCNERAPRRFSRNTSSGGLKQKTLQNYRDLVARVAGYSAFFTALSPEAQDDIIARTEHSL